MKKTSEPITFFGSGPVAAQSLELLAQNFDIEAVITKPALAHHRGDMPVLTLAKKLDLPIRTVTDKQELEEMFATDPALGSRVAVLIDFGIMVPDSVINYFPLGIVNSHFSLLPELRGADPITFAILNGLKETGVSLMLLVKAMDEGPLLSQTSYSLPPTITTPELTEALIEVSYAALSVILPLYMNGDASAIPQDLSVDATYSRKLTKEDGIINWSKPAAQLEREVRALLEWPKSHAKISGIDVIITKSHVEDMSGEPGDVTTSGKNLIVYCKEKALAIDYLKPLGKKEMPAEAFLAGYHLPKL